MELIRGRHNLRARLNAATFGGSAFGGGRGCALAIGNFDGVHRGHETLIARAQAAARGAGVPAGVMTFEPMPREFFRPDQAPPRISEFRDKQRRFERAGVDLSIVMRFDAQLAAMAAEAFVEDLLFTALGARAIVVGADFRFGARRAGDVELLRIMGEQRGIAVDIVESVLVGDERCSSTAIREALGEGNLARVQMLLGRPYTVIGRVRHGFKLGRKLGMPTTNLMLHHRPAARLGVYAVRVRDTAQARWWNGVASLGVRPTIGGTGPLLESHVFDNAEDWYGREQEVELCHFLRPEQKFDSLDALAAQMQRDGEQARALLAQSL